jgi:uncharacterized iron-regulated membrane protein
MVFVDPYTNRVRGRLTTWFGETPLASWLDGLHRNLHLGAVGRAYSELAASWLWLIALAGVLLWLRRHRRPGHRLRRLLLPELTARRVRRTRSWHATAGVWLLVVLLGLSATGLSWSRYAGGRFTAALDGLHARTPELVASAQLPPADPAGVDRVVATARAAGLDGPIRVDPPAQPGDGWVVAQTDRVWPVRFDRVAVSPDGAAVTARSNFGDWPLLARLAKLGALAHGGYLFGLANQLLLAITSGGLVAMIFWGYRMWWQRRPTRADRRAPVGTPPARHAWLRLPGWAIVIGLPAAAAIVWAAPELGVSLLAFLVADMAVGAYRRRRAMAPA